MKLWIARDEDGTLCVSNEKPRLSVSGNCWLTSGDADNLFLNNELFPEVTIENSPQEVEIKLVNEIVGVAESPSKTFPRVNEFEVGASCRR